MHSFCTINFIEQLNKDFKLETEHLQKEKVRERQREKEIM